MVSKWGEDEEAQQMKKEKISVGFMWNFISMSHMVTRIDQEVGERENDYPKSELMKIWLSAVVIIQILAILTHSVIMIATLPFIFFYALLFFKISGVLKRFGYPRKGYWALTIFLLIVIVAVAVLAQSFIFGTEAF